MVRKKGGGGGGGGYGGSGVGIYPIWAVNHCASLLSADLFGKPIRLYNFLTIFCSLEREVEGGREGERVYGKKERGRQIGRQTDGQTETEQRHNRQTDGKTAKDTKTRERDRETEADIRTERNSLRPN